MGAFYHIQALTFRDKPVKARVKSEHLLRSDSSSAASPTAPHPYYFQGSPGLIPSVGVPQMNAPPWVYQGGGMGPSPSHNNQDNRGRGRRSGGERDPRGGAQGPRDQQPGLGGPRVNNNGTKFNDDKTQHRGVPVDADRKGGKNRKGGRKQSESKPTLHVAVNAPQLSPQNFPPLPSNSRFPQLKSGYTQEFKKFSKEEILKIVQGVTELSKPTGVPEDCGVVLEKPVTDLQLSKESPDEPRPRRGSFKRNRKNSRSAEEKHAIVAPANLPATASNPQEPKADDGGNKANKEDKGIADSVDPEKEKATIDPKLHVEVPPVPVAPLISSLAVSGPSYADIIRSASPKIV